MKLLFVHEWSRVPAEAEADICQVADGLKRRGHRLGLLHGPGTGTSAVDWLDVFSDRFLLLAHSVWDICQRFYPDVIYAHNVGDLRVLEALLETDVPRVRVVRNHTGRFPLRWTRKRELKLNRRFHRLVVGTNSMKQQLLRDGFALDKIEVHRPRCSSVRKLEEMFARVLLTANHHSHENHGYQLLSV